MYRGPKADGDKSDTAGRVKVHYCGTRAEMELVCRRHFLGEPVIGLDMEWMIFSKGTSSARENVSLIQIASPSRVALFHIARFPGADGDGDGDGDLAAPTFRRIMADAGVSKTGVNILADCTRLKKHLGVDAAGIVELSHLYRIVKFVPLRRPDMINRKLVALAAQVEDQLGLPLFKGDAVRTGDWMKPLSKSQVRYAASDVYASIQLYHVMESKRQALDPRPAPPFPAELGLPVPVPQFAPTGAPSPSAISGDDVETVEDIVTKDLETLSLSHVAAPAPPKPKFSSKAAKPKSKATRRSSSAAADPRVLAADLKLEQYRSSRASVTTRPSSLRAYYLWADEDALTPESIASLLRDPPLQTSTVAKYILDAMSSEKLPFDAARARRELLPHIHPHLLKTISSLKTFPWDDPPSS
ncbi:Exonuclease 3'-5' domain-containing protein 2 [Escovopsis weberi]|uniref:Exonuclease 3'-5' domain-containing protein 2 n=1 Tax=Escovopsis weberi TaxID=150374 RepID=A0A0M8N248_ESCWE|nr:Exonuclease 3'-5' domain-containing protein 2 [Escovopsis weberi]